MSKMAFDAYLEEAGAYLIPLYDTIINNQLHKYKKYKTFDTKVVSLKKHLLSYEVTGQVIINNQKH